MMVEKRVSRFEATSKTRSFERPNKNRYNNGITITIVNIRILVGGGFCLFVFIFRSQYNHSHLLDCSFSNVSLNTLLKVHIINFMGLLRTFMKYDGMG